MKYNLALSTEVHEIRNSLLDQLIYILIHVEMPYIPQFSPFQVFD